MSWEVLEQVVAARVLLDAFETSDRLHRLGIRHALVGGLAVGHHGHPRATKDVDFIVGDEAFAKTEPLLAFRDELASVVEEQRRHLGRSLEPSQRCDTPRSTIQSRFIMRTP